MLKSVNSANQPNYGRTDAASFVAFESRVRALLVDLTDTQGGVRAEPVGWAESMCWFRENVAWLTRPATSTSLATVPTVDLPHGHREQPRAIAGRNPFG